MDTPAMNHLIERIKTHDFQKSDFKLFDFDTVLTILVFQGLKMCLPELKAWVKLGFSAIATQRLALEKKLKDYALEKELDYQQAEQVAEAIAQNINEENLGSIIQELEAK